MEAKYKHLLPSSYVADSKFTDDCFCHLRNNVCDVAQFLREGLLGRLFKRENGNMHIEGGFPHMPIDHGRKDPHIASDQILDTRFYESVGTYQANNENTVFRLNSLNVFAIGYILRHSAEFCVRYKYRLQLLIDAVICTMLPKFRITRPADRPLSEEEKYYELVAQDPTNPKEHEFYVAIPSGEVAVAANHYYFFNEMFNSFQRCAVLNQGDYFLKTDNGYSLIGVHTVGDLRGKDIYQRLSYGTYRNVGNAWDKTSNFGELIVVIPGLTKNNVWSNPADCILFRQVVADDTAELASKLYVDCTNEDLERLKNYINILIRHYRSILTVSHRKKFKYREILDSVPFTIEDIVLRINALVDCCDFRDTLDRPIINSLRESDYSIREMKLKVNELVDAINQEAFFLKFVDINDEIYQKYNLDNIVDDFLDAIRFNEDAWDDLVASSAKSHDQQTDPILVKDWTGYCYNDLGFVYNPYDSQRNQRVWDALDFRQYNNRVFELAGTVQREYNDEGDNVKSPLVCVDEDTVVKLSEVLDLVLIADVWRACDYIGSMYILDCTVRMMKAKSPDNEHWTDGLANPRVECTAAQRAALLALLDKLLNVRDKLDLLLNVAPLAALTVVDLGVRVSDYAVAYTCE